MKKKFTAMLFAALLAVLTIGSYSNVYAYGSQVILYVNPINDQINVRSLPQHDSALVGTVSMYENMYFNNETSTGYGSDGKLHFWYRITSDRGVTGWVRDDLVCIRPDNYNNQVSVLYVNPVNDYINVRAFPQHLSPLAGTVSYYEKMYFYGETGTGFGSDGAWHYWYRITSESGVSGWVREDLVCFTQQNAYSSQSSVLYVNPINDNINVRSMPAHNSSLMGTVSVYEKMHFYGETATGYGSDSKLHYWYRIT
ncbi:MAG: hypothetical protein HUJ76_10135, partial [Parasporobacterium sp.]|nr:hypothetical protein [Parasporobacterium sp.]